MVIVFSYFFTTEFRNTNLIVAPLGVRQLFAIENPSKSDKKWFSFPLKRKEIIPDPFIKIKNRDHLWISSLNSYTFCLYYMAKIQISLGQKVLSKWKEKHFWSILKCFHWYKRTIFLEFHIPLFYFRHLPYSIWNLL